MRNTSLIPLGLAILTASARAQVTCPLVYDINRTVQVGTSVTGFVKVGSFWYFAASDTAHGQELWRTDGTASGTSLVKDINPGGASTGIDHMIDCGGTLYFRANDGTNGSELWKSNGTAAGTVMVKDIFPGSGRSSLPPGFPSSLVCMGGKVYFSASDAGTDFELWCSDGTSTGTVRVKDIRAGTSGSYPSHLLVDSAGTTLYFSADNGPNGNELWKSDGTTTGTVMVKDIRAGLFFGAYPSNLTNLGTKTLFSAYGANGSELWATDGTATGTVEVKDIFPGVYSSSPNMAYPAVLGGKFYFTANDGTNGTELWTTDGTTTGTVLVKDINSGSGSSSPSSLHVNGSTLYFAALDGSSRNLYRSDGTATGTVLVLGGSNPSEFANLGNRVLFSGFAAGTGRELWESDGTATGTKIVKDIDPGPASSHPNWMTEITGGVIFSGSNSTTVGQKLYKSDGTASGTAVLKDIRPGSMTKSSDIRNLAPRGDGKTLYFAADDGVHGSELWVKEAGKDPRLVKDINPGASSSDPTETVTCWMKGKLVTLFTADDGTTGGELWCTDGTAAGTTLLKDIEAGSTGSFPLELTCCGNRVYFRAKTSANGAELWRTDGTATGTVLVKDIGPGTVSSFPIRLICCKGKLFFQANTSAHGSELWCSDGTATGTAMLTNHNPRFDWLQEFTCCEGKLFFTATGSNSQRGQSLWCSDGTAAGTVHIRTFTGGSGQGELTCFNGKVFFSGGDRATGAELDRSDGTATGTSLVKDISPGQSFPRGLVRCEDKLFFGASDGKIFGLWCSDGTSSGTKLVSGTVQPSEMFCANGGIYFTSVGTGELYFSDGTSTGTVLVCDIYPGDGKSGPRDFVVCDGTLYFTADDGIHGRELHRLDRTIGTVEKLGQPCGSSPPTLDSTAVRLGKPMTISGTCAPASGPSFLTMGLPGTPATFSGVVQPQCVVWANTHIGVAIFSQPAGPSWKIPILVPDVLQLLGLKVILQSAYGPAPAYLSNAIQVKVGN